MELLLSCAMTILNVDGKSWWLYSIELRLDRFNIAIKIGIYSLLKEGETNVRAKWDGVNSVFLVQLRIIPGIHFAN
jgi:hypothetical protein